MYIRKIACPFGGSGKSGLLIYYKHCDPYRDSGTGSDWFEDDNRSAEWSATCYQSFPPQEKVSSGGDSRQRGKGETNRSLVRCNPKDSYTTFLCNRRSLFGRDCLLLKTRLI